MHNFFPGERPRALATGDHGAGATWGRGPAQPHQAPAAGIFPPEPAGDCERLGHRGEPAPAGRESTVREPGSRPAPDFSQPATGREVERNTPARRTGMKSLALALIRFYQASLSPALPSSCRYYPSCSFYAYQAVEKWGVARGAGLALRRLLRCRPFGSRGFDPVP